MASESLIQVVGLAVQVTDRILLTGLLIRVWGVQGFAHWTLALSAAALIALFDLGANLYFANQLLRFVQNGDVARARRDQQVGNFVMSLGCAIGFLVAVTGFAAFKPADASVAVTPELWLTVVFLAATMAIRAAVSVQMSVYRAHEQFARQSLWLIGSDAARLMSTLVVVLAGGSPLLAAAVQLAVGLAANGYAVLRDSPKRFPAFPLRVALPSLAEIREAAPICLGFWIQSAPMTALTYLPIFFLSGVSAAGVVAQFAVMRTLSNVMRTSLQPLSVVFGQESARRLMINDSGGVTSTYREGLLLLAGFGAWVAGGVIALGPELIALWTNHPEFYDAPMLVLALAPPMLLPALALGQAYLVTINDPWPVAWARVLQLALTFVAYLALPLDNPGLRMFAALALGEIVGLGLIVPPRVARTARGTGWAYQVEIIARMAAIVIPTVIAARGAADLVTSGPLVRLTLGTLAGGAVGALCCLAFALFAARRAALLRQITRRLRRTA